MTVDGGRAGIVGGVVDPLAVRGPHGEVFRLAVEGQTRLQVAAHFVDPQVEGPHLRVGHGQHDEFPVRTVGHAEGRHGLSEDRALLAARVHDLQQGGAHPAGRSGRSDGEGEHP